MLIVMFTSISCYTGVSCVSSIVRIVTVLGLPGFHLAGNFPHSDKASSSVGSDESRLQWSNGSPGGVVVRAWVVQCIRASSSSTLFHLNELLRRRRQVEVIARVGRLNNGCVHAVLSRGKQIIDV